MSTTVLVIVQTRRGEVQESSFAAVGAGLQLKAALGGRLVLGLADAAPAERADALAFEGVDEVLTATVDGEGFDPQVHEAAAATFIQESEPVAVLFAHSVDAMAIAPALAAAGGCGLATDVIELSVASDGLQAGRAAYGGELREVLSFSQPRVVLTVRPSAFKAPTAAGTPAPSRAVPVPTPATGTVHRSWIDPSADAVDITKADLLVSVGRPIGSAANVARVDRLATALGGVMSASRPVVDAGWAETSRQVGQTGRSVKPKVYLALGISGAIQHIAGMASSETVIAVNTDPTAPIFNYADYSANVDMMDLIEALEAAAGVPAST